MRTRLRPAALALAAVTLGAALAACTSQPDTIEGVIGTPTPTPTKTTPPPKPVTIPVRAFPRLCPDLVSASDVLAAVGRESLPGTSTRIYAGPLRGGSEERLTCSFAVVKARGRTSSDPGITVTTQRYRSAAQAQGRVATTADSARGAGKRVQPATVAGLPGFLVSDKQGSYLALPVRDRTLVVEAARTLVRPEAAPAVLTALAESALGVAPAASPG